MTSRKDRELELYREKMGDDKANRQATLAKYTHNCCGQPKDQGHAAFCPNNKGRRG